MLLFKCRSNQPPGSKNKVTGAIERVMQVTLEQGRGSKGRGGGVGGRFWHVFSDGKRVGSAFINLVESPHQGEHASLQIFLNAHSRGRGIGREVYRLASEQSPYDTVYAHMRKSNEASKRAAEAAGFRHVSSPDRQLTLRWDRDADKVASDEGSMSQRVHDPVNGGYQETASPSSPVLQDLEVVKEASWLSNLFRGSRIPSLKVSAREVTGHADRLNAAYREATRQLNDPQISQYIYNRRQGPPPSGYNPDRIYSARQWDLYLGALENRLSTLRKQHKRQGGELVGALSLVGDLPEAGALSLSHEAPGALSMTHRSPEYVTKRGSSVLSPEQKVASPLLDSLHTVKLSEDVVTITPDGGRVDIPVPGYGSAYAGSEGTGYDLSDLSPRVSIFHSNPLWDPINLGAGERPGRLLPEPINLGSGERPSFGGGAHSASGGPTKSLDLQGRAAVLARSGGSGVGDVAQSVANQVMASRAQPTPVAVASSVPPKRPTKSASALLHNLHLVKHAELDFVPDYEGATPQTTRPIRGPGSHAGEQFIPDSTPSPSLGRELSSQARTVGREVMDSVRDVRRAAAPAERAVRGVASEVPGVLRDARRAAQPAINTLRGAAEEVPELMSDVGQTASGIPEYLRGRFHTIARLVSGG